MDILNLIGSLASIASLFVSLFVASKVLKITRVTSVGRSNVTAGRDVRS